jgi:3-methyladenine DNA glycosylase AlkD
VAVRNAAGAPGAKAVSRKDVEAALAELRRLGTTATRVGLKRYGIIAPKAFGVPVSKVQQVAKRLGRSHALALALWKTGWYEARLLACYVGESDKLTVSQMDAWCRSFDNWGVVDTVCFVLFDRSPLALGRIPKWAAQQGEFQRRAGVVLLACVSAHRKDLADGELERYLPLLEKYATDERNFVKKGVLWALNMLGRRRGLRAPAAALARKLAASESPSARWIGRSASRALAKLKA